MANLLALLATRTAQILSEEMVAYRIEGLSTRQAKPMLGSIMFFDTSYVF
jgi:hypothetical protein